MNKRPRKHELETMSVIELVDNLIWDTSNNAQYRSRLIHLLAQTGTKSISGLLADDLAEQKLLTHSPAPEQIEPPDYRILLASRKSNGGLVPLVQAMKSSGWDMVDPRGKMYTTPDEVDTFLKDVLDVDFSYQTMSPGQCNMMDAIAHSFGAWLRSRRTEI